MASTFRYKKDLRGISIYLLKNGIFIQADLKARFTELDDLIRATLIEYEVGMQHGHGISMHKELEKLIQRGPVLLKALETEVQGRLWDSQETKF